MKSISNWFRHAWIVLLVAGTVIALDQWSKNLVRTNLPKFEYEPVLGPYFGWEHVDNYGAAFGLFHFGASRWILSLIAIGVVTAILIYVRYIPEDRVLVRIFLGLQVGGAVGNLIDRMSQGFVTDFVKMGIPGFYYWPNWNIADAAIVVGTIGLALYIILEDMRSARAAKANGGLPGND